MNGLRKGEFARLIGVSASRVSQLITDGLPVELDDTIDEAAGIAWCIANVRPAQRMKLDRLARVDWSAISDEVADTIARQRVEGLARTPRELEGVFGHA